jgi:hypothetical protein
VAPWSAFWERNFFVSSAPALQAWLDSPFLRGAISGIGGVTALAGLAEIGGLLRRSDRSSPPAQSPEGGGWNPNR